MLSHPADAAPVPGRRETRPGPAALLEETFELMKARLGPDDPATLISMSGVAASYWSLKRLDKSVPLFEAVLALQEKNLGRDNPSTMGTVANLRVNYKDAGRLAKVSRCSRRHTGR